MKLLPESSSQYILRRLARFRKSHVNVDKGTQRPRAEDEPQERAWKWLQEALEDFPQWLSWLKNIQESVDEVPEPFQVCFFGQIWWRTHTCLLQVTRAKGLQDIKKETSYKQENKRRSRSQSSVVVQRKDSCQVWLWETHRQLWKAWNHVGRILDGRQELVAELFGWIIVGATWPEHMKWGPWLWSSNHAGWAGECKAPAHRCPGESEVTSPGRCRKGRLTSVALTSLLWLLSKPTIKRYHRRYILNEPLITRRFKGNRRSKGP